MPQYEITSLIILIFIGLGIAFLFGAITNMGDK